VLLMLALSLIVIQCATELLHFSLRRPTACVVQRTRTLHGPQSCTDRMFHSNTTVCIGRYEGEFRSFVLKIPGFSDSGFRPVAFG
jgi:hypothetical protein